jgi:hypothetical protein
MALRNAIPQNGLSCVAAQREEVRQPRRRILQRDPPFGFAQGKNAG